MTNTTHTQRLEAYRTEFEQIADMPACPGSGNSAMISARNNRSNFISYVARTIETAEKQAADKGIELPAAKMQQLETAAQAIIAEGSDYWRIHGCVEPGKLLMDKVRELAS